MQREQFQLNFDTELSHWWFVARRRIVRDIIAEVLPPSPQHWIVDVGCGTGGNIGCLGEQYSCVGIDPSPEAIQLAQTRFPSVRFVCGEAPDDLGELAQRARLLLLMDVLEHVADDFALLSQLLAATRPGTFLLLTVPADPSLWSRHDESHGHYRRYDMQRLSWLWRDLPVGVLLHSYFNTRLYPAVKLARLWNRWRATTSGDAGTDIKSTPALVNWTLEGIFAGERKRLRQLLRGQRSTGYRFGVSLMALLRREAGPIEPRRRATDVGIGGHLPKPSHCETRRTIP